MEKEKSVKKYSFTIRVDKNLYDHIIQVTSGEHPEFAHASDYIIYAVTCDIERRDCGVSPEVSDMLRVLQNPEVIEKIDEIVEKVEMEERDEQGGQEKRKGG